MTCPFSPNISGTITLFFRHFFHKHANYWFHCIFDNTQNHWGATLLRLPLDPCSFNLYWVYNVFSIYNTKDSPKEKHFNLIYSRVKFQIRKRGPNDKDLLHKEKRKWNKRLRGCCFGNNLFFQLIDLVLEPVPVRSTIFI